MQQYSCLQAAARELQQSGQLSNILQLLLVIGNQIHVARGAAKEGSPITAVEAFRIHFLQQVCIYRDSVILIYVCIGKVLLFDGS
jgi:hypothetical protein